VRTFQTLAALMALVMLVRHGRLALGLFAPPGREPEAGRLAGLPSLLTCLVALAVLVLAARGLLSANPVPGVIP
jgi:hypothetical protein